MKTNPSRPPPPQGEVILVCGPLAAGKSTWVRSQAKRGDQVVDFDQICRSLGSRSHHDHPPQIRQMAKAMRRSIEDHAGEHAGRTFVIRTLPDPAQRAAVAERLGARVVMFAVPMEQSLRQARHDGRPAWTEQAIRSWYDRYEPSPVDTTPET